MRVIGTQGSAFISTSSLGSAVLYESSAVILFNAFCAVYVAAVDLLMKTTIVLRAAAAAKPLNGFKWRFYECSGIDAR